MVSEYEARKLQRDSSRELDAKPATVWKCAAGLVTVALVALIGTANDERRDSGGGFRASGYLEAVAHQAPAAAAASADDLETPEPSVDFVRHDR